MNPFEDAGFGIAGLPEAAEEDTSRSILTFRLGGESFGISVAHVREVLETRELARVPNAPPTLLGMIDLRGAGVPVVDLKAKLRMPDGDAAGEADPDRRIVVLDFEANGRRQVLAVVADAVHEVAEIRADDIEPPPEFGEAWNSAFMTGLSRRGEVFLTLLDVPRLFAGVPPAPIASSP